MSEEKAWDLHKKIQMLAHVMLDLEDQLKYINQKLDPENYHPQTNLLGRRT